MFRRRRDFQVLLPLQLLLFFTVFAGGTSVASADPLSSASRARLARKESTWVIVEFDGTAADRAAQTERAQRHLAHDDDTILRARSQSYASVKSTVEGAATGLDGVKILDYPHFPLAVWRISSLAALERLQTHPLVRAVHDNKLLRPVSRTASSRLQ